MEKKENHYIKPNIKVNDFISRHNLMWEIAEGTTEEQLSEPTATGPDDPDFTEQGAKNKVWGDME